MTENTNQPLVTFAVFSYNQEEFIRAAVEAALSQDYSPLEVIISDDCSTDQTFAAIQQCVEAYKGPHKVIARQTRANCGTLLHVADVAAIAEGGLIILAAGDDVSKENRTSVTVEAWKATGAWGLCSRFDIIDAESNLIESSVVSEVLEGRAFAKYFREDEGPISIIHGCTSAYDARAFQSLVLNESDFILSEDGLMSVMLNVMGKKILHLDDSLVLYRQNPNSLTNGTVDGPLAYSRIEQDEQKIEWFARAQANRCRLFLRMEEMLGQMAVRRLRKDVITKDLRHLEVRGKWSETGFYSRVRYIAGNFAAPQLNWALPRLFGKRIFFALKWAFSRFRSARQKFAVAGP